MKNKNEQTEQDEVVIYIISKDNYLISNKYLAIQKERTKSFNSQIN